MKPTFPQPVGPRDWQKWGLFMMLAGSLGFSLSMNPDHFNHIARYEGGSGVFEMAQTAAPEADQAKTLQHNQQVARQIESDRKEYETSKSNVPFDEWRAQRYLQARHQALGSVRELLSKDATFSSDDYNELLTGLSEIEKSNPRYSLAEALKETMKVQEFSDKQINEALEKVNAVKLASHRPMQLRSRNASPSAETATNDERTVRMTQDELNKYIADQVKAAVAQQRLLPPEAQNQGPSVGPSVGPSTTPPQQSPPANAGADAAPSKPQGQPQQAGNGSSTPPVAGNPPNQPNQQIAPIHMSGTKGYCVISVDLDKGKAVATAKSDTAGKPCHIDNQKKELTSSIGDIRGAKDEILAWFEGKSEDKDKEDNKPSKSEIAKGIWEKETKNCRKKGTDASERMECYQDALVKLSEKLDDSNESKNIMKKYFNQSLAPLIKAGFMEPTTDPFTLTVDTSRLNAANDMAKGLLEKLGAENTEGITQSLMSLKAGSYSAQANYARQMFISSQDEKNSTDPYTRMLGMRKEMLAKQALNPQYLGWELMRDRSEWSTALTDGGKSDQMFALQSRFYSPVSNFLSRLPKADLYNQTGSGQQNLAALQLAQLDFPDLSGMGMNVAGGSSVFTPGLSTLSSIPERLAQSRLSAVVRGANIPAPSAMAINGNNNVIQQAGRTVVPATGGRASTTGRARTGIIIDQ